jgi:amino acid adenylation domain-containing protein
MASAVESNKENGEAAGAALSSRQILVDEVNTRLRDSSLLQPRKDSGPVPLSFAQERLWFLEQIDPGDASAHISRGMKVTGALDRGLLRQSLETILNRHESLRATFATTQLYAGVDGQPTQLIAKKGRVELAVVDLSAEVIDRRISKAREFAQSEAQRGFDLTTGPLLRITLLVLEDNEHILLVTAHRIISDDHSLDLLLQELWLTYGALASGARLSIPDLPLQFADYASWQRNTFSDEFLRTHSDYWRTKLEGAPAVLELPADRPRPAVQNWRGESLSVALDEDLGAALRALARAEHTTLFVVLMAAFQILLARYSRQDDLVVGSEFSNRESADLRNLVGPLSNAFALRADLSGNPPFCELLRQVQTTYQDAAQHRLMPYEKLVDEMELERSLSFAPVFQVALNLRETSAFATPAGLLVEEFEFDPGVSRFDLTLDIEGDGTNTGGMSTPAGLPRRGPRTPVPLGQQIRFRFEYDSDLFDRETIARMAAHFEVLLRAIVQKPKARIADLPLLSSSEQNRIVYEWNDVRTSQQTSQCLHELFAVAAQRMPEEIALVCGEERLTYSELNRRANQLAHYLQKLGIGPEQKAGVYLERSVNNIVALLAILKAGGAFVPIDPAYPQDRVTFMLADSGVQVLITQQSLITNLPEQQAKVIQIDSDWHRIAAESDQNPTTLATPENLAYVIYTSGSTGRPKGVSVTHKSVTHLFAATREQLGFNERDVWTTVHSSAFDFSVWEIWGALLEGRRLVVVPLEVTQSPNALYELLQSEGVTILNQTPSALRQLLDAKPDLRQLSLRTIVCGGDALDSELAETLTTIGIPVWNFYGPTESTVWATCTKVAQTSVCDFVSETQVPRETQTEGCATSIGRPIADLEIYVLDENLGPVPVGVPGEICIGGAGLARGYLNLPALTADRFVPSPFARSAGERLYRTGDLGRHLRSGKLEFLGRLDNQVKLRGFRVELGEIETVLGQHAEVDQAVVIIREDQPGDKRLVAYVVPCSTNFSLSPAGQEISEISEIETNETNRQAEVCRTELPANLRHFLSEKLPEYMIPSAFVMLDALPLTPNRKVDRRSLPKPETGRRGLESSFVAPRDNLEQQLANIWQKILDVKVIGVRDSFFELGGHSLLAVRLFAQIENRFGRRLPLAALFQAPTIEQLANVLRQADGAKAWSSLVAIQPQGSRPPLYCVHAAGANVLIYRPLSRHLGNDQPVYALQARGLDGQQSPFLHVEEMAAHYIREMRAFQPEGPYHLLGASFGGLVIFEMAQQLLAQGQRVGLLAMLNTNCPVYPRSRKIRFHLEHLKEHGPAFYSRAVWQTVRRKMGQPTVSVEVNTAPDPALARLVADRGNGDEALVRTVLAILDAEKDYVPRGKIYPGKITLFRAEDVEEDVEDNRLGWEKLARRGLKVYSVPGTHISIREEPHVAVLAEKLRECLEAEPP